jgi:hypothetical protein
MDIVVHQTLIIPRRKDDKRLLRWSLHEEPACKQANEEIVNFATFVADLVRSLSIHFFIHHAHCR